MTAVTLYTLKSDFIINTSPLSQQLCP